MNIENIINQHFLPLKSRFSQLFAFGKVTRKEEQTFQVQFSESDIQEGIKRVNQAGFHSNPKLKSSALIAFPDGLRTHGLALFIQDSSKNIPKINEGSACIYAENSIIEASPGGKISIRNSKNELIETLIELIEELTRASVKIPTTQATLSAPNGPATGSISIPSGAFDNSTSEKLKKIKSKIESFKLEAQK